MENIKKFLSWEEKVIFIEELIDYAFDGIKLNVFLKHEMFVILVCNMYGGFSDFINDRIAEDNEYGFVDIMNIGKTYNHLIQKGIYSKVVKSIDKSEFDLLSKLVDESITEKNRELNSFINIMNSMDIDKLKEDLQNLDHAKINSVKEIVDKLNG